VYDLTSTSHNGSVSHDTHTRKGDVEVSLNPEDLEKGLHKDLLQRKYNEEHETPVANKEDFSDMVAEHAAKQTQKKQKKGETKKKEFKF
jgi:splicing factor 3B subunit 2